MRHGLLRDSDIGNGNFLNSTGWHDHFLNSTGRHYCNEQRSSLLFIRYGYSYTNILRWVFCYFYIYERATLLFLKIDTWHWDPPPHQGPLLNALGLSQRVILPPSDIPLQFESDTYVPAWPQSSRQREKRWPVRCMVWGEGQVVKCPGRPRLPQTRPQARRGWSANALTNHMSCRRWPPVDPYPRSPHGRTTKLLISLTDGEKLPSPFVHLETVTSFCIKWT